MKKKTITTTPTTKQTKRHNSKTNVPSFCGRCFTFLVLFLFSLCVRVCVCVGGGGRVGGVRKPTKTKVVLGQTMQCQIKILGFLLLLMSRFVPIHISLNTILEDGEVVDLVYLDFQEAFDKVRYERLLLKLRAHGITGQ